MSGSGPQIWLITGKSGAGKTSFCRKAVEQAKRMQFSVSGVLSPAVFRGGVKTGIEVEEISSGKKRLLASLQTEDANSITPRWKFDADALRWGSEILDASVPCELLVVDELGPIELVQHQGWVEGIRAVNSNQYRIALVVVRSSLLALGQQLWHQARVFELPTSATVDVILKDLSK